MPESEMCDCCYNVSKQMTKKAQFLSNAEGYLRDAELANHRKCAEAWRRIIRDEKNHLKVLKGICDGGLC